MALQAGVERFRDKGENTVLTEGTGGKHMEGSLHYKGLAIDLRTNHTSDENAEWVAKKLRSDLGPEYDVVLEYTNYGEISHLHIEFDPKGGKDEEV